MRLVVSQPIIGGYRLLKLPKYIFCIDKGFLHSRRPGVFTEWLHWLEAVYLRLKF